MWLGSARSSGKVAGAGFVIPHIRSRRDMTDNRSIIGANVRCTSLLSLSLQWSESHWQRFRYRATNFKKPILLFLQKPLSSPPCNEKEDKANHEKNHNARTDRNSNKRLMWDGRTAR
jgi:hypothetical protein